MLFRITCLCLVAVTGFAENNLRLEIRRAGESDVVKSVTTTSESVLNLKILSNLCYDLYPILLVKGEVKKEGADQLESNIPASLAVNQNLPVWRICSGNLVEKKLYEIKQSRFLAKDRIFKVTVSIAKPEQQTTVQSQEILESPEIPARTTAVPRTELEDIRRDPIYKVALDVYLILEDDPISPFVKKTNGTLCAGKQHLIEAQIYEDGRKLALVENDPLEPIFAASFGSLRDKVNPNTIRYSATVTRNINNSMETKPLSIGQEVNMNVGIIPPTTHAFASDGMRFTSNILKVVGELECLETK